MKRICSRCGSTDLKRKKTVVHIGKQKKILVRYQCKDCGMKMEK